jgi:hypothetical protein
MGMNPLPVGIRVAGWFTTAKGGGPAKMESDSDTPKKIMMVY